RAAAHAPHPEVSADAWRILVVANESLEGEGTRAAILGRAKLRADPAPPFPARPHTCSSPARRAASASPDREAPPAARRRSPRTDASLAFPSGIRRAPLVSPNSRRVKC